MKGPAPLRRVVYVVSLFPCWSETFIVREIQALVDDGIDVRILSLKPPSESLVHADAAALLERVRHPRTGMAAAMAFLRTGLRHPLAVAGTVADVVADSWRRPRAMFKSLAALARGFEHARWLREFDPDFIHAHWATYPSTVAWALGRVLGKPFGFTCHAHDIFVERQLLARKLDEAALAVTISDYNTRWLQTHAVPEAAQKLKVVHCGVDLAQVPWRPDSRKAGSILAVGRLHPVKGFDTLVDALALLHQRGTDFNCRIVGAGQLEGALRERTRRMGVSGRIEFTGAQAQDVVRRWMDEATVFALPSQVTDDGDRDGIPVVLMEAMASGCAVVSTRVSGIPELIDDGIDGLLVEPRDPVALADALERLLGDDDLRRRLASSARRRIETHFDARKEAARLRGHMQQAMHATPAADAQPPPQPATAAVRPAEAASTDADAPGAIRPLRVLYVVSLFPCWSETFILREMHALIGHGASIGILSLKPSTEDMVQERAVELLGHTRHPRGALRSVLWMLALCLRHPLRAGAFLAILCTQMWLQPGNLLRSLGALCRAAGQWRWIREFDPQIIHAPWATYPATVAWFLSQLTGKPWSFTSRAHDIFVENHMMPAKLAGTDLAVTITRNNVRHMAQWMKTPGAVPIQVVHSALDLPAIAYRRDARLPHRLLSVGRLDPIKGFDVLLPALAELQRRGIAFESVVIGEGEERERLEAQRDALDLRDQVDFVGARPNTEVRQAMAEATLMVMPCVVTPEGNADGIPNVLTEAMASGLPVVSTRISGIPELIDDGISGRLVEPRDPIALADAIAAMLADPALCDACAAEGRRKVEAEFDVQREAGRLLAHMAEVAHA